MLLAIALTILTHLVIPAVFLAWLWRETNRSKLDWLLKLLVVALYIVHIFLIGRWDWFSYYLRFGLVILLIVAAYQSFIKVKALPLYPPRKLGHYVSLGISSAVILFFIAVLGSYIPQGYSFGGESIQLAFPLKSGVYYVGHGGNHPTINYHNVNPTQRYALDIAKLNAVGTRANGLYPELLTNYAIFGETLYSPCNSTVRKAVNNFPDLVPPQSDRNNPAGNHILIECKGADVLLAHLQRGSLTVQERETVEVEQAIAKVGNSGNTTEPHLHIHARQANTGKSVLSGEGMPMLFSNRFLTRNSVLFHR
ncbi:MAG: M23 family metallopeptidase [Tildeniella nuda ZEHNDER 1965/U140]|jgi:hypothetical protein|nr:M23 family metallopeptidase [Tildeniella nuda ZEHNDER 1965/U140]